MKWGEFCFNPLFYREERKLLSIPPVRRIPRKSIDWLVPSVHLEPIPVSRGRVGSRDWPGMWQGLFLVARFGILMIRVLIPGRGAVPWSRGEGLDDQAKGWRWAGKAEPRQSCLALLSAIGSWPSVLGERVDLHLTPIAQGFGWDNPTSCTSGWPQPPSASGLSPHTGSDAYWVAHCGITGQSKTLGRANPCR